MQEFLIEAADTLHRLPDREKGWLEKQQVAWPEFISNYWDEFGNIVEQGGKKQVREVKGPPSRNAIDRLDEIMGWLRLITGKHEIRNRKVVFFACYSMAIWETETIRWAFVKFFIGENLHHDYLRQIYNREIDRIAGKLTFSNFEFTNKINNLKKSEKK